MQNVQRSIPICSGLASCYNAIFPKLDKPEPKLNVHQIVVLTSVMRAFQNRKKYFIPESFRNVNNKNIFPVMENMLVTKYCECNTKSRRDDTIYCSHLPLLLEPKPKVEHFTSNSFSHN